MATKFFTFVLALKLTEMNEYAFSTLIIVFTVGLLSIIGIVSSVISFREKEHRAAFRLLVISAALIVLTYLLGFSNYGLKPIVAYVNIAFLGIGVYLFIKKPISLERNKMSTPKRIVDEHNVIFARMRLKPNTPDWEKYYSSHPFEYEQDSIARKLPGLLSPKSNYYNPFSYKAADVNFEMIDYLHSAIDHPVSEQQNALELNDLSKKVKEWTLKLGAHSVGITELKDYHAYTVRGRGKNKGKPVELEHKLAIAFTVEMDIDNVQAAPASSIVMESSQQYLNAAVIALQITNLLKGFGYESRAHIDGDYELICPLVAADAGLGEIGRMGLLMTPKLGPRVRIAVVTTNAPLLQDKIEHNNMMIEFCRFCKKCADCCPSQSIPKGEMKEVAGVLRWQIDSNACYKYWCSAGTDCGRCMAVCPFSHPDNILHNAVRHLIVRSRLFARFAYLADDFLYGRRPKPKSLPKWLK